MFKKGGTVGGEVGLIAMLGVCWSVGGGLGIGLMLILF
jgi:hypothetical protein